MKRRTFLEVLGLGAVAIPLSKYKLDEHAERKVVRKEKIGTDPVIKTYPPGQLTIKTQDGKLIAKGGAYSISQNYNREVLDITSPYNDYREFVGGMTNHDIIINARFMIFNDVLLEKHFRDNEAAKMTLAYKSLVFEFEGYIIETPVVIGKINYDACEITIKVTGAILIA